MRDTQTIVDLPELAVYRVSCPGEERGWSAEEPVSSFALVLASAGLFKRTANGSEQIVDAVTAYIQCPGEVQRVAHPAGGDESTVIVPSALMDLLGDRGNLSGASLVVTPEADLAHRLLLARAAAGADADELAERAVFLTGRLVDRERLVFPLAASRFDRRLAARVRASIEAEQPRTLFELAADGGVSPYRLSRAFQKVMGLTVTAYRSQLRTRRALARLAAGDRDLAAVSADVGFADQAHLTRTVKRYTGSTPATLRRLLAPT